MAPSLKICYYVTGHGLGHATRVIEVCHFLLKAGHEVTICTGAPAEFFSQQLPYPGLTMRDLLLDCGAFQLDAFTVDMKRSLEEYHKVAEVNREKKLQVEVKWLQENGIELVVSDIVPLACAAAREAGVPAVGVSNFSWDFIYSEYLTTVGTRFKSLIWQIAEDYAKADLLLRLPGHCPMPAFREVIDVPLVARTAKKSAAQVKEEMGLSLDARIVVFMFGGQPAGDWHLRAESLPPGWKCIVCSNGKLPGGQALPENFILASKDAYTPDLIGASDCLLGKIGYGTVSEALAHGKPFIFSRRDHFNEEPFLRKLLEINGLAVEIRRRDFLDGNWRAFISHAATLRSSYRKPVNGAEVTAELLVDLANEHREGESALSRNNSLAVQRTVSTLGSNRLKDAVVYGYIMQRHARREKVEIPEWYSQQLAASPEVSPRRQSFALPSNFTVKAGNAEVLAECDDTLNFLNLLTGLDNRAGALGGQSGELPEQRAARGLFRFHDDITVTRAPGRLDVMGGIADYSGSLVLQMPIAQACHVAAQTHPPGADLKLWRHIVDRHASTGKPAQPVVRIVSLKADTTNRGHAFDMDLAELFKDGNPIPYADARALFEQDPSQSWAAYIVGAIVVLMHELGHKFEDGISILVSSDVPDGKGVSSSAALECAAMSAISAACGIQLEPHQVALLCQKVENLVVGAPCGVMDQMASVLGQKDSLMALKCQPAKILPPVIIPKGLKFWGVDSGVRHSVGGSDYGSVRAGAFMGLKIISALAEKQDLKRKGEKSLTNGKDPKPQGSGYLTNIPPSLFRQFYEAELPELMEGSEFLEKYGQHWDTATKVDPGKQYPVAQATLHAISENFRVQSFRSNLSTPEPDQAALLAELMYQSHASYTRCGLGSDATDRLVALARQHVAEALQEGRQPAIYGAKITGGGSGGTVCFLGKDDHEGEMALQELVRTYSEETGGFLPTVLTGSSMGAAAFGSLKINLRPTAPTPTMSGIDV